MKDELKIIETYDDKSYSGLDKIESIATFDVAGAGKIQISESATWYCGNKAGFHIGVEWGRHGLAGGVLSREDARKLANMILDTLDNNTFDEDEGPFTILSHTLADAINDAALEGTEEYDISDLDLL